MRERQRYDLVIALACHAIHAMQKEREALKASRVQYAQDGNELVVAGHVIAVRHDSGRQQLLALGLSSKKRPHLGLRLWRDREISVRELQLLELLGQWDGGIDSLGYHRLNGQRILLEYDFISHFGMLDEVVNDAVELKD